MSANVSEITTFKYRDYTCFCSSYSFENIQLTEVPAYQKQVFNKFGFTLNQFHGDMRHPDFMDYIMRAIDADIFIFFDIDCIPLRKDAIDYLLSRFLQKEGILGIEQQCNCNASVNHIYAGPACFLITKDLYEKLGRPSFTENYRSDVAEEITYICQDKGICVDVLRKTHSNGNQWQLGETGWFGNGTTYENDLVYHQFSISSQVNNFIEKCKMVLAT
ncbi:MAG: hypothetical protein DKM50_09225 [Candidatus Margulisiibacteriota bacterium]|nr:MAG: hypothetical protein DKM50_09225 [Candidatus Margulisiibacteriota bacterium]HCY38078.1 hypothetical protein [Candidatus Margulisiibacteriota bacterium]